MTTVFEPRVQYVIEQTHPMTAFQRPESTGLHNHDNFCTDCVALGTRPYRGIAVHNWWLHLSPEEVLETLHEFENVEFEVPAPVEVAGFPGIQIDATVPLVTVIHENRDVIRSSWHLHFHQRMRFVVVDTPAGSLLITTAADIDEFENFLPRAEEILAGISFPDL